jgi:hypothetical protein
MGPYRTAPQTLPISAPEPELRVDAKEVWKNPSGTMKVVVVKTFWENLPKAAPVGIGSDFKGWMMKLEDTKDEVYLYELKKDPQHGPTWMVVSRLIHKHSGGNKIYDANGLEIPRECDTAAFILTKFLRGFLK